MSKILNTDFLENTGTNSVSNTMLPVKEKQSFLFAMDDCTDLNFSSTNESYMFDDCTDFDFDTKTSQPVYAMDDCSHLSF